MKEAVMVSSLVAAGFALGSIFGASLYHKAHDTAFKAFAYAQQEARYARAEVANTAQGLVGHIAGAGNATKR